jgi:hypothetical protein
MKASNRYTTSSFSVAKIAHKYTHPLTIVEASITLMKEDKPKEFIAAIKLLLTNGQRCQGLPLILPTAADRTSRVVNQRK